MFETKTTIKTVPVKFYQHKLNILNKTNYSCRTSVTDFEIEILTAIEQVQENYASLCAICDLLNEAYGLQLLMLILRATLSSLCMAFFFIHVFLKNDWGLILEPQLFVLSFSGLVIINFVCLFGITFSCSAAAREVS